MATVPVTLVGITYAASSPVGIPTTFVGEAFVTGLGVGGGPMPGGQPQPPLGFWGGSLGNYIDQGLPGRQPSGPIGIWGGGGVGNYPDAGFPGPQPRPPLGFWGGNLGNYIDAGLPGPQPVPPNIPNIPEPGSPPQMIGGSQPVQPIVPPNAVVIEYPGVGKVIVPKPTETFQPENQPQA